jgi:hypothetical protein
MKLHLEFGGNYSGFQRTRSHLLPALLSICYQHYQRITPIRQLHSVETEKFMLESLEPRGFEPLTSSMPLRRSTN